MLFSKSSRFKRRLLIVIFVVAPESRELSSSEYLDVQSRMDRYTANNALLMYKQFPQASQIKEFDDWAAEGVKVNKGSKTFIILDPYEYTKKDGTIGVDFIQPIATRSRTLCISTKHFYGISHLSYQE